MVANEFTLDDLKRVLDAAAGESEQAGLGADILDVPFTDLGYDSVAMLETSRRIELERGIVLADSTVADAETPRALLAVINEDLTSPAAATRSIR